MSKLSRLGLATFDQITTQSGLILDGETLLPIVEVRTSSGGFSSGVAQLTTEEAAELAQSLVRAATAAERLLSEQ